MSSYRCYYCGKIYPDNVLKFMSDRMVCPTCLKNMNESQKPATDVDIHKIIDDAMEKKDRSVTIFINKDATTVSVYPYEDKPREWVPHKNFKGNLHGYTCPECGHWTEYMTNYCSECGEKIRRIY